MDVHVDMTARLYHQGVKADETQLFVRMSLDGTVAKIVRYETVKGVGINEHLVAIAAMNSDGGWDATATDGYTVEHRTFGSAYSVARYCKPLQDTHRRIVADYTTDATLDHTAVLSAEGTVSELDNARYRKLQRDAARRAKLLERQAAAAAAVTDVSADGTVTIPIVGESVVSDPAAATNTALDTILG